MDRVESAFQSACEVLDVLAGPLATILMVALIFGARENELAREWQWLVDVLNKVARARAENEEAETFRLLQQQCVAVGQRRVELHLRIAALTAPSS